LTLTGPAIAGYDFRTCRVRAKRVNSNYSCYKIQFSELAWLGVS
jgi:hypothetical protein